MDNIDVCIIGAGPSGAVAAALLVKKGYRVVIFEKTQFPRFSIGESLLPQCMAFLEAAGMTQAVSAASFQFKDGAMFNHQGQFSSFDFTEKTSTGPGTTFQVQRDQFDHILANEAARLGAEIHYQHEILSVDCHVEHSTLRVRKATGDELEINCRFVLDGSGFGRVLPRLLNLDEPSNFPVRQSFFTHIEDNIQHPKFDRDKILITIHPKHRDVWYWLIPFSNGRSSVGVVAREAFFAPYAGDEKTILTTLLNEDPILHKFFAKASFDQPARTVVGYSANVKALYGEGFALLGNAGEFLDPVFSSGVTIAMKSAMLASEALDRQLRGQTVDWNLDYAKPLKKGIDTFREFVEAWYDQRLQNIILHPNPNKKVKTMICAILAGYAWDETNPYVKEPKRRLNALAEICALPTDH